jgi:hypothetical protein
MLNLGTRVVDQIASAAAISVAMLILASRLLGVSHEASHIGDLLPAKCAFSEGAFKRHLE